jgi:Amt family ammonium transporter
MTTGAVAATMWIWKVRGNKPDTSMMCNGMLAGLVAITAPCAFVAPWAAAVIGVVAGFVVCYGVWFFDHVAHVDDPCGAISVHGVCGAWGLLAVGLFADGTYGIAWNGISPTALHGVQGIFYGDPGQLGAQIIDLVVGFIWAWGVMWILFRIAMMFIKTRVSPEVEIEGLDEGEFGAVCYPDFVLATTSTGGEAPGHDALGRRTSETDASTTGGDR